MAGEQDVVIEIQARNPTTGHYIKRNLQTGRIEVKTDGKPFKGVPMNRIVLAPANSAIDPETAQRGEEAVIEYLNKKARQK
ncbi:hypothetical protein GCM10023187_05480 [Nibrella viscosa]|uniref:Uncharacterized protein n=1 Tax=Nibrella viscosa TaxID=1084524 RepID=A0ABP8JVZ9_9BACT